MTDKHAITYLTHTSIHEFTDTAWDLLFSQGGPCLQHAFLACLEDSHSVGHDTGWQPHHLAWYRDGQLVAAMPGYIKAHSYGEYIFDHGWADAYHRYGLQYYPKWINAIPFTPVTQQRIGYSDDPRLVLPQLLDDIQHMLQQQSLSSAHCLYLNQQEISHLAGNGWAQRNSVQFEWQNRDYADFDAYLAVLTARRRRSIKKERKNIDKQQVNIQRKYGENLTQADMDFFYQCYQMTYLKRSGHHGYLTEAFFKQLFANCAANILLVIATIDDKPVAASMYLYDERVLYGRYWGALEDVSGLHFECCYYQGIAFVIEQKIARFNPGTQGEHKILRGFVPTTCHSLHYLAHPQMHAAVEDFVERERPAIEQYRLECMSLLPFNDTHNP